MKKQTAVEFLGHELNVKLFYDISPELWEQVNEIFKQALAMEKEQIIDAYYIGADEESDRHGAMYQTKEDGIHYYHSTYGQ